MKELMSEYSDYFVLIISGVTAVISGWIYTISRRIRSLEDWKVERGPACNTHSATLAVLDGKFDKMDQKLDSIQVSITDIHVELSQRVAFLEGKGNANGAVS